MAIVTVIVTVSRAWSQVSPGSATIQSKVIGRYYHVAAQDTTPTGDAHLTIDLDKIQTFDYKAPVWVRLPDNSVAETERLVVIK
jgi:hypothetical protein